MKKFIAGVVIGLMLSAVPTKAQSYTEAFAALIGIRVELQRIANALDRIVSQQSGATRAEVEKRNQ